MFNRLKRILIFIPIIIFAAGNLYAENVKLRYASSIYTDSKGGIMRLPEGVGCSDDVLLVADSGNGRLLKYEIQNGVQKGGDEIKIPEIPYPQRVQLSPTGDIFVFDGRLRRIARLSPDGVFKSSLSLDTKTIPRSFKLDRLNNIYVLDIFGERVLVLDQNGKQIRSINFPEKYGFISDLAIDSIGNIYLIDSTKSAVYIATKESQSFSPFKTDLKEYINFPSNITVDTKGVIYISDLAGGVISILTQDGTFRGHQSGYGWKEGLLRYPSQICINEKGNLFVADRENSRVQVFTVIR
jgi:sugar lactone lactonase YvrE